MKKIFCGMLALCMAFSMTACSKESSQKAGDDDFVKLKYYMFGSPNALQGRKEVYAEANKIIKEKINAEVDFVILDGGQFGQKMPVLMSSGEKFDLMFTSSWLNDYATNVAKGALLPLDDLLPQYAPEYYAQIPADVWDAVRINGKIYAGVNEQIMARQSAFVFRQDMLDKTGFDMTKIKKFSDIDEFMNLLVEKGVGTTEYDYTGGSFTWQYTVPQSLAWEPLNTTNVPGCVDDKNTTEIKVFNQFKSPEFIEYITYMNKWQKMGLFHMDSLTGGKSSGKPMIVKAEGTYIPITWKQATVSGFSGYTDLAIQPYGETYLQSGYVTATLTGVNNKSENPERAVQYLNLVNTDKDLYRLLTVGIEGRDYKKLDDMHIEIMPSSQYTPNADWAYGCQFNAFLTEGLPDNAWETQREYNASSNTSPLLGFNFDTKAVQTEIANCEAISSEYLTIAQYGMMDPETKYQEFIKKLDDAGAEKIMAEMQRQVDEFIKSKNS